MQATAEHWIPARFRLVEELGRGTRGVVYRAHDEEAGVEVALKTLVGPEPGEELRLKAEFRTAADLGHRNLVELYELFVVPEGCFFTMELVDGQDFVRYVGGPRDPGAPGRVERFRSAATQLASALRALHVARKIHRDVKPSNVLVTPGGRVVLLDFGFAIPLGSQGADASMAGTVAYMAPEQAWAAAPGPESDWYAAGVLFYEALAGRPPFEGDAATVVRNKMRGAPPPPSRGTAALPTDLDELVVALLSPDPSHRPDGEQVLRCLDPAKARRILSLHPLADDPSFVGRTTELASLRDAFDRSVGGQSLRVVLTGPAGIGKTALVRTFLERLEAEGAARVLYANCSPHESVPFNAFDPIVDRLSELFPEELTPGEDGTLDPLEASALLRTFPVTARVPWIANRSRPTAGGPDVATLRTSAFEALRKLLAALARELPLVVAIDDAQWADADSVSLVRALLRPPVPGRLLLLFAARSGESLPIADQTMADVGPAATGTVHVDVGPMPAADLCSLVDEVRRATVPFDRAADAIAAESAGSPLLACELVRRSKDPAPETPRDLISLLAERIDAQSSAAVGILEAVAIAGEPLDRATLLSLGGTRAARPVLTSLGRNRLLRLLAQPGGVAVDVYHDRVRDAVLSRLGPGQVRDWHHRLARVLEHSPTASPEALFRHYAAAGEREPAARYATRAAERAAASLAFLHAADLYARALELRDGSASDRIHLLERRAEALANAGHGGRAAEVYFEASRLADDDLRLRRCGWEQLFLSGRVSEAIVELRSAFEKTRIHYPLSGLAATAGLFSGLLQLACRDGRYRGHARDSIPPAELERLDALLSAGRGLIVVDPLRGSLFCVRHLVNALRAGDASHVATGLLGTGAIVGGAAGPLGRLGRRWFEQGRRLAARLDDPYLKASALVCEAALAQVSGLWTEALELCERAGESFSAGCQGAYWERNLSDMGSIRALEELGRIREAAERTELLLRRAEDAGDRYARVTALLYRGMHRIVEGDVAGAEVDASDARREWAQETYSLQRFYALRLETVALLYRRCPSEAFERVERDWQALRRSGLLRNRVVRVDAHVLRGVTCVAFAESANDRNSLLRRASKEADRLERLGRQDALAHSSLLRAGIASLQAEPRSAVEQLRRAADVFDRCRMRAKSAIARSGLQILLGRDQPSEPERTLRACGVAEPADWSRTHAPGLPWPVRSS